MLIVKKLVYNYIFDEVLTKIARSDMQDDFLDQDTLNLAPNLQAYIDRIIQPIRNRLPQLPLDKKTITANPFTVLNAMTFILDLYEQEIVQAQQQQPEQQQPEQQQPEQQQPEQQQPEQQRQRRVQSRLFSLFPNPSYKWRFIKLDGENLNTVFHDTQLPRQDNESSYHHNVRCFFEAFNFEKLDINR